MFTILRRDSSTVDGPVAVDTVGGLPPAEVSHLAGYASKLPESLQLFAASTPVLCSFTKKSRKYATC